jgi:hypothetical protein
MKKVEEGTAGLECQRNPEASVCSSDFPLASVFPLFVFVFVAAPPAEDVEQI